MVLEPHRYILHILLWALLRQILSVLVHALAQVLKNKWICFIFCDLYIDAPSSQQVEHCPDISTVDCHSVCWKSFPLKQGPIFLKWSETLWYRILSAVSNMCTDWYKLFRSHVVWDNLDGWSIMCYNLLSCMVYFSHSSVWWRVT